MIDKLEEHHLRRIRAFICMAFIDRREHINMKSDTAAWIVMLISGLFLFIPSYMSLLQNGITVTTTLGLVSGAGLLLFALGCFIDSTA